MPRQARAIGTSGMYHILVTCIPNEPLFRDNEDRYAFLERLYDKKVKYQFRVLAYCLLDQAYHLIVHEHKSNLATIMKSLNVSYASYMHKKYAINGPIFKDRYKSECLSSMPDVLSCIAHVHLQPVEHHLSEVLEQYQWSSFGDYVAIGTSDLISKEMVLSLFDLNDHEAIKSFREYHHHVDNSSFLKHEISIKKHYASLLDAREYIQRQLLKYQLQANELALQGHENIRNTLVKDLRQKTALSINDIGVELEIKRSQVLQALYSKRE